MGKSLGSIFVDLLLKSSGFKEGLTDAERRSEQFKRKVRASIRDVKSGFGDLVSSIFSLNGAIGTLLGGAGLTAIAKAALDTADSFQKMADRTGESVQAIQEMSYAAALADVDMAALEGVLGQINKRLGTAAAGGQNPFKQFGIDIRDASGEVRAGSDVLADIADRFAASDSAAYKASLTFATAGKAGAQMGALLKEGGDGIRAAREEAVRLGLVLDSDMTRQAAAFNDQMTTLGKVIRLNFQKGFLSGFLTDARDLRDVFTDPKFVEGINNIGEALGNAFKFIVDNAETILKIGTIFAAGAYGAKRGGLPGAILGTAVGMTAAGVNPGKPEWIRQREAQKAEMEKTLADIKSKGLYNVNSINDLGIKTREVTQATAELNEKLTDLGDNDGVARTNGKIKETTESVNEANDAAKELGLTFTSAFEDAIVGGKKLKDVLSGLAQDIFRFFIRKTVTEPGANLLGNVFGNVGGFLSNLLPGFASGGHLAAGKWGIVGEEGPELAYGGALGKTIIPNDAIKINSGAAGNTYIFDNRGADAASVRRLEQIVIQELGPGRIEQRVLDAQARGML